MKAINTGNIYEIFDDSVKTFDKLPTQSYVIRFDKHRGFFLEKYVNIEIKENKIYGVHLDKVEKVLTSFSLFNRSLGVILSGDKGIGKSLFAKLLATEAVERNIPLIVVDTYIPGIASYIESIEQEVMILFDEFDKTFGEVQAKDGEASPQANLLGLFDGVSGGKKLYVITCNELRKLNDYLINRPGRFHYHFRFDYPSSKEIREYLEDKIPQKFFGEIDDVIAFSKKVNLNYDCLRAIAFEISQGEPFKGAIKDLNIINMDSERYSVVLHYANGMSISSRGVYLDLFNDDNETVYLYDKRGEYIAEIDFNPTNCEYDPKRLTNILLPNAFHIDYTTDNDSKEFVEQLKAASIEYLSIARQNGKNLHYVV